MKSKSLIIFLLISVQLFSQNEQTQKCINSEKLAITDFEKNKLIGHYSHIEIEFNTDTEFEMFYQFYVFSKYSILIEFDYQTYDECYIDKMNSLIREKFGNDIYSKTRINTLNMHKNFSRDQKSKTLDLSKYYPIVESKAKYAGNDYQLFKYLKESFKSIPQKTETFRTVILLIDQNGKLTDFETQSDNIIESINKKNIIDTVNSFGTFIPAYILDTPVNSRFNIYLF
jgi:hypothetical protein